MYRVNIQACPQRCPSSFILEVFDIDLESEHGYALLPAQLLQEVVVGVHPRTTFVVVIAHDLNEVILAFAEKRLLKLQIFLLYSGQIGQFFNERILGLVDAYWAIDFAYLFTFQQADFLIVFSSVLQVSDAHT